MKLAEFRQFIPWVYSFNTGHSKTRVNRSSEILWLTKGEPHFCSRGYSDSKSNSKSVKKKIAEGITGVASRLVVIQQVKNVNKEYSGYKIKFHRIDSQNHLASEPEIKRSWTYFRQNRPKTFRWGYLNSNQEIWPNNYGIQGSGSSAAER